MNKIEFSAMILMLVIGIAIGYSWSYIRNLEDTIELFMDDEESSSDSKDTRVLHAVSGHVSEEVFDHHCRGYNLRRVSACSITYGSIEGTTVIALEGEDPITIAEVEHYAV